MPVGVPPAVPVTVAVNVTDWLPTEGFGDELSEMALGLSTVCVTGFELLAPKVVSPL